MLSQTSFDSYDLTNLIDHGMGEEYNIVRYVADNLPALMLLVQKLAGEINLAALLDDKLGLSNVGVANGIAPLGPDIKIPGVYLPGGSVADHEAKVDPHPQYLTNTRGDVRYPRLDLNGYITASQLPSFVDDVLEFPTPAAFPAVGESGKIYVGVSTNSTYRWSGSTYIVVGDGNGLGNLGTTDSLVEGAFNLYYTNARVRAATLTGFDGTLAGTPAVTDTLLAALGMIANRAFNHNHNLQYAALVHSHLISDITGLQAILDNKQAAGSYLAASTFNWTNLPGKPTTLSGYGITDGSNAYIAVPKSRDATAAVTIAPGDLGKHIKMLGGVSIAVSIATQAGTSLGANEFMCVIRNESSVFGFVNPATGVSLKVGGATTSSNGTIAPGAIGVLTMWEPNDWTLDGVGVQ